MALSEDGRAVPVDRLHSSVGLPLGSLDAVLGGRKGSLRVLAGEQQYSFWFDLCGDVTICGGNKEKRKAC